MGVEAPSLSVVVVVVVVVVAVEESDDKESDDGDWMTGGDLRGRKLVIHWIISRLDSFTNQTK